MRRTSWALALAPLLLSACACESMVVGEIRDFETREPVKVEWKQVGVEGEAQDRADLWPWVHKSHYELDGLCEGDEYVIRVNRPGYEPTWKKFKVTKNRMVLDIELKRVQGE